MRITLALILVATSTALACPDAVTKAIEKRFPKSSVSACVAEKEDGRDQFDVKLATADKRTVEVDVAPDGTILEVEEAIAVDKVPGVVMKAFGVKYGKAKVTAAAKETPEGKPSKYELAFEAAGKKKEATFAADGTFLEEEAP